MSQDLPKAEVVRRYVEESFHRTESVLALRWPGNVSLAQKLWELPDGVNIVGPAPQTFGFHLQRTAGDAYSLRLQWNRAMLCWTGLSKMQLLTSSLAPLLSALGKDLWSLLEEPVRGYTATLSRAA